MDAPTSASTFQVSVPGVPGAGDELGVWEDTPTSVFPAPDASRWQVQLPEAPALARQALVQRTVRLRQAEQALPEAASRLDAFLRQGGFLEAESFTLEDKPSRLPERELAAWVSVANQEASFGLSDLLPEDWSEVTQATAQFFDKVRRSLLRYAMVETIIGGRRRALTVVSWGGDFQSAWARGSGQQTAQQHARSLELAIRSRDAWLRMALIVVRTGLRLTVLFPATPVLALPAAYKFVKQVLEQVQTLQELQNR